MQITLHYTPGTRAARPRWLLEELGIPYELNVVDLFAGGGRSVEYRAVHPLGQVPALEVDGEIQIESGAICHWLADRFSDRGFAPSPDDPARAAYEQWMFFVPGSLEPPAFYAALHSRLLPESQRVAAIVPWCMKRYLKAVGVVGAALAGKRYLVGDKFTAADIMVGTTLIWVPDALKSRPILQDYVERLRQRPAYVRATQG